MLTVGIFVFDEVEVLDFAGPFEVFSTASRVRMRTGALAPFRVLTIGKEIEPVHARGALSVLPQHSFRNHPPLDVVVVPGGDVTRELENDAVIDWVRSVASTAQLTAAVCTGAFLLGRAGLLHGRRVTTHWEDIEDLTRSFPEAQVESGARWVDEGDLVTSAGISAGIDMSLHLVRRLADAELAARTARQMDYDWRDIA